MAKVLIYHGFRVFFFSNEGTPREPIHVHVRKGSCLAKIWLEPHIDVADNDGFTDQELSRILKLVGQNATLIKEVWNGYFD